MGYGINKRDNEYSREVCDVDASKTVWMAIALSFAIRIAGDPRQARQMCIDEWAALHDNGIVPQKPRIHQPKGGHRGAR